MLVTFSDDKKIKHATGKKEKTMVSLNAVK